ncbi:MAG: hypothetical protein JSS90_02355 [Bacteroidetes bacterium]|jgi:hypothetical protein|nr:hypothetical protein [Bacteroidota bacterium]
MALQIDLQIQNKIIMDLIIAILMYLGVYATPADLNNKDFQEKNANQIQKAQQMAKQGTTVSCDGIVILGSGAM